MASLDRLRATEVAEPNGSPFDALFTAVLLLDSTLLITTANRSAETLFPPASPQGQRLPDFLDMAEKLGRLAQGGGLALMELVRGQGEPTRQIELKDGRIFIGRISPLAPSGWCLELTDVTVTVRSAELRHRDALTGLPNRQEFLLRLSEAAGEGAGKPFAVHYVDLDRFKSVNDTLGHPIGDALLKLAADRMRNEIGPRDVLARLGGDEFAILQLDADQPQAAETLARRIIDLVGRAYLVKGHMISVGASVGISLSPLDGTDPETLLKKADLALMRAKQNRGTAHFFEDQMDSVLQARRAMEVDLRRAVVLKEFSLAYQPQFSVDGRKLVGFEALMRWTNRERGAVSPGQFIPLAEEIGLIVPIGEWALRTACMEAASWPAPLTVAVNLSPVQFRTPRLVEVVTSALAAAGLAPSRLDLEITEGALLDDTDTVLAMLQQLRALGVRISMDDFGTGYSSLSYLQKFPFNKIKIDQSFIRRMADDPDSASIVRAVAALGTSLGMTTVAEGVETEEQFARIRQEGCEVVQGYLTGRPLTPEAAAALVQFNKL